MKILLTAINAKYIHSNLAIRCLRANAGEYREMVELAEFTINNRKEAILRALHRRRPDVLCFSCYLWNLDYVEYAAREFHKLRPKVPIWVGGPEVSYETEDFLKRHEEITGVMIGEGEVTFRELCAWYAQRETDARADEEGLEGVAGLMFRRTRDGRIVQTKDRAPADLRSLLPGYDPKEEPDGRIVYYESSRGCPFSCSYCLSSIEKCLRFREIGQVKKDLKWFLEKEVAQVKFVDRTFNCNRAHALEIWRFLLEHDNGVTNFHFEISADLLQEEELEVLEKMRPGLVQLEIGVQSVNERTIREIKRTMDPARLKEVVERLKRAGNLHQHLDLIAGLPFEDYQSFGRSFDEIYALMPHQLQLGFLKVLKGSYLYEHVQEYGILYCSEPPYEILATNWMSYEELLAVKQAEEMLEVYYNSGQYMVTTRLLHVLAQSDFLFFRQLGAFYERRGYQDQSHTRLRRCEILLEFLKEGERDWMKAQHRKEGAPIDMMQEALTFDLYYRENCKTRPRWAPDPSAWKEKSRECCTDGKLSHVEAFHYRFPLDKTQIADRLPVRSEQTVWALFRYTKRDPLDGQAEAFFL